MPLEDIRGERIKKLEALLERGEHAYPAETARTNSIAEIRKKFAALAKNKKPIIAAGRMMAKREHGGAMFLDVRDGSGTIQAYFKKDVLGDEYERALETIDI